MKKLITTLSFPRRRESSPIIKNSKKAFTLIELLVVVSIISVLSVVAYTAVGGYTVKARDAKRKQDINTIQKALEMYYIVNGSYPASKKFTITAEDNKEYIYQAIDENKLSKKFISNIPQDPKKIIDSSGQKNQLSYFYQTSSNNKSYQLGTTLESEDGYMQAYIITNSDKESAEFAIQGKTSDNEACTISSTNKDCFHYIRMNVIQNN